MAYREYAKKDELFYLGSSCESEFGTEFAFLSQMIGEVPCLRCKLFMFHCEILDYIDILLLFRFRTLQDTLSFIYCHCFSAFRF